MVLKCLIFALTLVTTTVIAAERNDVPSCYTASRTDKFRTAASGRMLTVVVDQTTPLNLDLQKTAWAHIKRFVQPGDKLRLYSFSAYLDGRYSSLQFVGELEKPLEAAIVGSVPMMAARKLDACLKRQSADMFQRFGKAFTKTLSKSSIDIPRSEILFSLKAISEDLQKDKGVNDYVIFIMSDMLEYSDFGSFYANNQIRAIDPAAELTKVEKQNLIADFGGARVYVHGAAFVPVENKNGYRSGKMIKNLETFWSSYFEKSNAELRGFGNPELTTDIE
jgi:hypothetical protein